MKTLRILDFNSQQMYRSNKFVIIDYYSPSKENTYEKVINTTYYSKYDETEQTAEYRILHSKIDNSITLYNSILYQPNNCNLTNKLISVFNSSLLKWNETDFYRKHYNFHGCKIDVAVGYHDQYIWSKPKMITDENGKIVSTGVFMDLLRIFFKKHNLKFEQKDFSAPGKANIEIIADPLQTFAGRTRFHISDMVTNTYCYEYYTFVISRGENFTPFEKLILPFDLPTWIMVILSFIIGYLTILILYQFPRYVQQFFFGTFNRDPSMTLAQVFFGIGLVQTPTRNFARFFFVSFSLYCLIIRTAYQGKMFDFLHSRDEKRVPENLHELIAQKIPVIIHNQQLSMVYTTESVYRTFLDKELNLIFLKDDEFLNLFNRPDKFGPDYAFAMYLPRYFYETLWKDKRNDVFYKKMKIFKDNHKMILMNWRVDPYCLVHESLEKFVLEAHQHGHVQYHISKYTPLPAPKPPTPGPQVLTIYMLSAGFIVWLVTVLAACLMFVFEHIYFYFKITTKIKKFKKKTKTVI